MPPKNKGVNKKAKPNASPQTEGLTQEKDKQQLKEEIVHLQKELERVRMEKQRFKMERDKILTFSNVTTRQLESTKAELKSLDKDIEEDERHHQEEIKMYKQKMKCFQYEHQNTISELKSDNLVFTETEMQNEMQETDLENLVKDLQQKHEEEMTETRNRWEKQLAEMEARHEEEIKFQSQNMENMTKSQLIALEDHWKGHMATLTEIHDKAVSEICTRCDSIREEMERENEPVKAEIKRLNKETAAMKRELKSVLEDNKQLDRELTKVTEENNKIEKQLKARKPSTYAKVINKELADLKQEHEEMQQKFSKLQLERDELRRTYTATIEEVQHKADVKNMLQERKLETLIDSMEKTQAQLTAVLSASDMDQTALGDVITNTEKQFDSCNNTIKTLQYKRALISKARKDLLTTYEAKLRAHGIPVEDISAKPFESSLAGKSQEQDLDLGVVKK